jgi:hypothetical protein
LEVLVAAAGVALLELDKEDDVGGDEYKARASYVVEIAVAERAGRDAIIYVAKREDGKEAASAIQGKLSVSLRDDIARVRGCCAAVSYRSVRALIWLRVAAEKAAVLVADMRRLWGA